MERRKFLELMGKGVVAVTITAVLPPPENISAYPVLEPFKEEVEVIEPPIPTDPLEKYLHDLNQLQDVLRPKVLTHDLFTGIKNFTTEQRLEDFEMYFPCYFAGSLKYGVPAELLWIIHIHETCASREPNPEKNGFRGAMQRSPKFYPDKVAQEAASDWHFLESLDQRYKVDKGYLTNDYEEILFAAWKIRNDADNIRIKNPRLNLEEAILNAQYNYCAPYYANQRIDRYKFVKSILEN